MAGLLPDAGTTHRDGVVHCDTPYIGCFQLDNSSLGMEVNLPEAGTRSEVERNGVYSTYNGGSLPVDLLEAGILLEAKTAHCDDARRIDNYRKDEAGTRSEVEWDGVYPSCTVGLLPDNLPEAGTQLEANMVHCDEGNRTDSNRKDGPPFGMMSLPNRIPVEVKMVCCN